MKNFIQFVLFLTALLFPFSNSPNLYSQYSSPNDSLKIVEKVYLQSDRDSYYPGDDIWFKAYLVDASYNLPTSHSGNLLVEFISPSLEIIDSRMVKLTGGLGNGDFHLPDSLSSGIYNLRAYTNYMRNFGDELFFNKDIIIANSADADPAFSVSEKIINKNPEISFFPEGGSLVDNVSSIVAFKSVDANGNSYDVTGEIYSSVGEKITDFKSIHKGMGSFSLIPAPGLSYFAIIKNYKGDSVRYEIPESFSTGVVLHVSNNKPGEISLTFNTNPETLQLVLNHDFTFTVTDHKLPFQTYSFRLKSLNNSFNLPSLDLPEGIVMLTLSGASGKPFCERLVFIQNNEDARITLKTDKTIYNKRDSVSLRVSLSDSTNGAKEAFLSLAATEKIFTDNSSRFPSTISSWFLLESDVRGLVEEPSYYFDPSNPDRFKDLDLLLLTQGWRDFDWKYRTMNYPPEYGFTISGRVRKKFADVPLQNSTVTLAIFKGGNPLIEILPIDPGGRFLSERFDLTGDAKLVASVTGDNDNLKGWLLLDSVRSAPATVNGLKHRPYFIQNDDQFISNDQLTNESKVINNSYHKFVQYAEIKTSIQKKYKLSDTIALGEVNIIAKRVDWTESAKSRSRHYLMGTPDKEIVITPELEIYNNAYQLLSSRFIISPFKTPGWLKRMSYPLYMIDGVKATKSDVMALPISSIERIDVVDDPASFAALRTLTEIEVIDSTGMPTSVLGFADGAISIILKDNYNSYINKAVSHSVNIAFSGYNEPRLFYSPRHKSTLESDYKPDLRTTLFWVPNINLESNKDLLLNYYNADNSTAVKITVEGITDAGVPVTASTVYKVK
jgi:hypothetical protein